MTRLTSNIHYQFLITIQYNKKKNCPEYALTLDGPDAFGCETCSLLTFPSLCTVPCMKREYTSTKYLNQVAKTNMYKWLVLTVLFFLLDFFLLI